MGSTVVGREVVADARARDNLRKSLAPYAKAQGREGREGFEAAPADGSERSDDHE